MALTNGTVKYLVPEQDKIVEMYFGNVADLVGTNWHPLDGHGGLVNANGRYPYINGKTNTAIPTVGYQVGAPKNAMAVDTESHNHSNQSNWSKTLSSNGTHTHSGLKVKTQVVVSSTSGTDCDSDNSGSNEPYCYSSRRTQFVTHTDEVSCVSTDSKSHYHTLSVTRAASSSSTSHSHTLTSPDTVMRLKDVTVCFVIYLKGVVYNG